MPIISQKLKRLLKILRNLLFTLIGIIVILVILINTGSFQNFLAQKATKILSDKLNTTVAVQHVRFHLFNRGAIEGLLVKDLNHDTLLYAGEADVRLSDLVFGGPQKVIHFVGLKRTKVLLHRLPNSEEWNFAFLKDAFSSNKEKKKKKSTLNLEIEKVKLQQVRILLKDEWAGKNLEWKVGNLVFQPEDLDFEHRILKLGKLNVNYFTFGITKYQGGRPESPSGPDEIDTTPFNKSNWSVSMKEIKIAHSHFYLEKTTAPPAEKGRFDAAHLNITGINAEFKNLSITKDTILGKIQFLSGQDRSGAAIKKMVADVKVSPRISECRNLYLKTGHSVLTDYYAMRYDRFPDFENYVTRVKMETHIKSANIAVQDIVYFAPVLHRYAGFTTKVTGWGYGTVAHLVGKNLHFEEGNSSLNGDFSMIGLPEIDTTTLTVTNAELHTNGMDAKRYAIELEDLKVIDLNQLSEINIKGNYTGLIRNFTAEGQIQTNLGAITAQVKMQLPYNAPTAYHGNITAKDLDLGKLLDKKFLGTTNFNLAIEGQGFNPKEISGKVQGQIANFTFNQYDYQNITINSLLQNKIFNGKLTVNDPNADFDFDGAIDLSGDFPSYDFNSRVNQLNFLPLHILKDSLQLTTQMRVKMAGTQINNLVGDAVFSDIDLKRKDKRLNVNLIRLSSNHLSNTGDHELSLQVNRSIANINGRFLPTDVIRGTELFLSYYLPGYITPSSKSVQSHNFQFNLQTHDDLSDVLSLISPDLRLKGKSEADGFVDLDEQNLVLNGKFIGLSLGSFQLDSTEIHTEGNYSGLSLNLNSYGIHSNDNRLLTHFSLSTLASRDTFKFKINTNSPTNIGDAVLSGIAYSQDDSIHLQIAPSQFDFNRAIWKVEPGNSIVFGHHYASINNLIIKADDQVIRINPLGHKLPGNNAIVELSKIRLAPINNLINLNGNNIGGLIFGTIQTRDLLQQTTFDFDLNVQNASLKEDTLGTLFITGNYAVEKKLLTLSKDSRLQNRNANLGLLGTIDLSHQGNVLLNGEATLDRAQISWITPLVEGVTHDVGGTATGLVKFSGDIAHPSVSGGVSIENATFTPNVTSVPYRIPKGYIAATNTNLHIDSTLVYDADGNTGVLSGDIAHSGLKNFIFNLRLASKNIKAVDQNNSQNPLFWGDINANVNMTLRGTWDDLTMRVTGRPLPNSKLFINEDLGPTNLGNFNYINFKRPYDTTQKAVGHPYHNKFNFILEAVATPDLETDLILDNQTGENLWSKGNGSVLLTVPSDGDIKMDGSYVITEGTYTFSFQRLQVLNYKREFLIDENSAIKWNGRPLDADLDVSAHTTVKARLYDLISGELERLNLSDEEIHDAQLRQDVDILLNMKGSLDHPDLKFKIKLAEGRSVGTYAYQKLQRLNTDEKQTLIQVSSLLLLNQFVPPEGFTNTAISTGTINNMSELLSSAASSQLSNFANKILGVKDLSVGVKYTNYSLSEADPLNAMTYFNRNEAKLNLRKNFLNDRLMVEVGGAYDWGQAGLGENYTSNLAGDFKVQYLLTPDGRVRFSIFRTSDYDPLYSLKTIGRQGVNISYRKSFNNLREFFMSRQRRLELQKEKSSKIQPASDTSKTPAEGEQTRLIKQVPLFDLPYTPKEKEARGARN